MVQFKANLASRAISDAIRREVIRDFPNLEKELIDVVNNQIELAFEPANSPEVDSMINGRSIGSLKAELGLTNPSGKIDSLQREIASATRVRFSRAPGNRLARLNVDFTPNYGALGGNAWARQNSAGKNGPNSLPWFNWMINGGAATLVQGWNSTDASGTPGAVFSRSRTNTIMRRSRNGGWSVPVQFAGRAQNNFVSRALNKRIISIRRQSDLALKRMITRLRRRLR